MIQKIKPAPQLLVLPVISLFRNDDNYFALS